MRIVPRFGKVLLDYNVRSILSLVYTVDIP